MQILREDPTYPEALIGRGTAYAFQRELDAAIVDFTKVYEGYKIYNFSACVILRFCGSNHFFWSFCFRLYSQILLPAKPGSEEDRPELH